MFFIVKGTVGHYRPEKSSLRTAHRHKRGKIHPGPELSEVLARDLITWNAPRRGLYFEQDCMPTSEKVAIRRVADPWVFSGSDEESVTVDLHFHIFLQKSLSHDFEYLPPQTEDGNPPPIGGLRPTFLVRRLA